MLRIVSWLIIVLAWVCSSARTAQDYDVLFTKLGLVDVATVDSTIIVNLKYATTDNFVGKNMYGELRRAYVTKETAKSLAGVQRQLKKIDSRYSLIIYDAGRPVSVQKVMWDMVKNTDNQKYVAAPYRGGPHNYGVAVDVGLALNGVPVDMGTKFDTFSTTSHITNESYLVKKKLITEQARRNREILRKAMTDKGFRTYRREWWHFERRRTAYARKYLRLIDF